MQAKMQPMGQGHGDLGQRGSCEEPDGAEWINSPAWEARDNRTQTKTGQVDGRAGGQAPGLAQGCSVHELYIETRERLHSFFLKKNLTGAEMHLLCCIGAVVLRPGQWVRLNRHYYTCYNSIPSLC